jgi:hypothetical protein
MREVLNAIFFGILGYARAPTNERSKKYCFLKTELSLVTLSNTFCRLSPCHALCSNGVIYSIDRATSSHSPPMPELMCYVHYDNGNISRVSAFLILVYACRSILLLYVTF